MPYRFAFYRYEKLEGKQFSLSDADYFVFHSPYNKVYYVVNYNSAASLVSGIITEILKWLKQ